MKTEDFKLITNAIETGKCLAFLGAGACTPFTNHKSEIIKGLPTGGQLSETLASQCKHFKGNKYDLLKVAEYYLYACGGDRDQLEKALRRELKVTKEPRPIHTVLAQLQKIKVMITTNYDNLLDDELDKYRELTKDVYRCRNSTTGHFRHTTFLEDNDVVLHKMHGSLDVPGSMVITRSDYIYYLANLHDVDRGMPEYFRKTMIPQCTLLFLGYGLEDWNLQVIWDGVLSRNAALNPSKKAFALVKDPKDSQIDYWRDKNIILLNQDLTKFAEELAKHFKLVIPQLGIDHRPGGGTP